MFKLSLFFLLLINFSFAQKSDISDFKSLHRQDNEVINFKSENFSAYLFSAYKTYVSSQDKNTCVYSPSCSEYALKASQKKGVLIALPQIFDRLLRCNSVHAARYPTDTKTGLALDEP